MRQKAIAVVAVLGLLFILSTIGITFVRFSSIERSAAQSYQDTVKARLVADAGLNRAINELRANSLEQILFNPQDKWVYCGDTYGVINPSFPIEKATYPSYYIRDGGGTNPISVHGRSVSGIVGDGTYEFQGDTYTLKIINLSGQLHINSTNSNLATMLDNLGLAIAYERTDHFNPVVRVEGTGIINRRTELGGLFHSKRELLSVLTSQEFEALEPYITIFGVPDKSTITPDPPGGPGFRSEPRVPVNINTASRPVLIAVLATLQAGSDEIDFDLARKVANAIIEYRGYFPETKGAFLGRLQFEWFIDQLTVGDSPILNATQAAIIKTNANPRASLKRFNPDRVVYFDVDKSELLYHTTEFCFIDRAGFFDITSLGRITSGGGITRAMSKVTAVVMMHGFFQDATQKEFEDNIEPADNTSVWVNSFSDSTNDPLMGYVELLRPQIYTPTGYEDIDKQPFYVHFKPNSDPNIYSFQADRAAGSDVFGGNVVDKIPLLAGGNLARDGVLFRSDENKTLYYSTAGNSNLPLESGTIMFWVKFNKGQTTTDPKTIFFSDSPIISSESGVQMDVKASMNPQDGTNPGLKISVNRYFYLSPDFIPEEDRATYLLSHGFSYLNSTIVLDPVTHFTDQFQYNEWYHIAISWEQTIKLKALYINGVEKGNPDHVPCNPTSEVTVGIHPYDSRFYFGGDSTVSCGKNLTIDDIQVFSSSTVMEDYGTPEKYDELSGSCTGEFKGAFTSVPTPVTLGVLYWTMRIPTEYMGHLIYPEEIPNLYMDMQSGGSSIQGFFGRQAKTGTSVAIGTGSGLFGELDPGEPPAGGTTVTTAPNENVKYDVKFMKNFAGSGYLTWLQSWMALDYTGNHLFQHFYDNAYQNYMYGGVTLVANNVSPVLEDITLTYQSPGVAILYYSIIED